MRNAVDRLTVFNRTFFNRIILYAAFAAAAAAPVRAEFVSRCPPGTTPVETADGGSPWSCILKDLRYQEGIECPKGFRPVTTTNPLDPFKCGKTGIQLLNPRGICPPGHRVMPNSNPKKDFECEKIKKGFRRGPGCPRGYQPVPTPGGLKPFRCIRREKPTTVSPDAVPDFTQEKPAPKESNSADRKKTCPKGTVKIFTENPFDPVQCVRKKKSKWRASDYIPYLKNPEVTFSYPKNWHLTDAWDDKELPSIYMVADTDRDGRPVTLSVSRHLEGENGYQSVQEAIEKEKKWHGANEDGKGTVGGLPAVFMRVKYEARTAFVNFGSGYYTIAFSSSEELFDAYVPAYRKLLETFRRRARRKQ